MLDTKQYPVQVRANARLVDAGRKTVLDCPELQQVEICIVLIADYNWLLEDIPETLKEEVSKELGLIQQ